MLTGAVDEALIDATIDRLVDAWETAEAHEGVGAFLERRKPDWTRFVTG